MLQRKLHRNTSRWLLCQFQPNESKHRTSTRTRMHAVISLYVSLRKQFTETIELCKQPAESPVQGLWVSFSNNLQNNQALQKASREFTAWIVSVNHKEIYRTIKLCKEPTECHSQKNYRTVKLCKQPTECHSQTIFRHNQALQLASWMSFTNNFQKQSSFASCHQRVQNMDQDCYSQTIYGTIKLCKKPAQNSVHGERVSQNIQALQSASREFSASIVSCCSQRIYRTIQVV
jgi:hypothetical protein